MDTMNASVSSSKTGMSRVPGRVSIHSIFLYVMLLLVCVMILIPFLWIFSTSLRLPKDSFTLPPAILPTSFHWENYAEVFQKVPFLAFILNSIKIVVIVVVGHIFISSMAAFAFSRISFPGRNLIFLLFLSGLMIPSQVTIIPQFILISKMGLSDTHWAIILPSLIHPLGIFLIRQMMMTIPTSYDEAAYMDGANRMWVFLKVVMPMSFPAVSVTSVLLFIHNWNDFFRPLIFLNTYEKMTLPLGMTVLTGIYGNGNLSAILAGVTLSLIPPLLLYIFGQKYLVEGITAGGLKV